MNQLLIHFTVLYQVFAIVPNPAIISNLTSPPAVKPPITRPGLPPVQKIKAKIAQTDSKPAQALEPVPVPQTPAPAPASQNPTDNSAQTGGCGDNSYANYIYSHESGCSTTIQNAEGCIGIGQACPASKLLAVCPNLDYACENSFFTAYANAAYGGWAGAYNFWLAHHWW